MSEKEEGNSWEASLSWQHYRDLLQTSVAKQVTFVPFGAGGTKKKLHQEEAALCSQDAVLAREPTNVDESIGFP